MQIKAYGGGRYRAVGCTNGIYIADHTNNSCEFAELPSASDTDSMPAAFRSVLESDKPTSIAAIPEFNAFIVHCESKLFSYRLDHIVRISQGDAGPKGNDDWEMRLVKDSGDVLFFKAGLLENQMLSE
jgi:hypothetical protein